jgi:hypothetical protein
MREQLLSLLASDFADIFRAELFTPMLNNTPPPNKKSHDLKLSVSVTYVRLALQNRCLQTPETLLCTVVAEGGYLETLKWLHSWSFPFDSHACAVGAAKGGHLEVLRWLFCLKYISINLHACIRAATSARQAHVRDWLLGAVDIRFPKQTTRTRARTKKNW